MEPKYTYSLNGSDWTGEFKSRKDARIAAIDAAHQQAETPGVIYVGKILYADAQTANHAVQIVRDMRERADRVGVGDYLHELGPEKVRDLDQAIAQTLEGWLDRHQLRPTQVAVKAISEYPVPTPGIVMPPPQKEVNEIGPTRQSA